MWSMIRERINRGEEEDSRQVLCVKFKDSLKERTMCEVSSKIALQVAESILGPQLSLCTTFW